MSEIAFDTLTAVRRLKEVQFTDEQAETITRTVRDGITGGVATKADIHEVRGEIAQVRAEVKTEISAVRTEIAESKAEVKTEIAQVRTEIAEVRTEIAESKAEVKTEIAEVRTEIAEVRTEIAESKAEVKTEIAEVRADIGEFKTAVKSDLKWMRVLGAGILAALSALAWAMYELHGLVAALPSG